MKISKQLSDIDVRLIKLYQPSAKTFTQEQAGFQGFKHLVDKQDTVIKVLVKNASEFLTHRAPCIPYNVNAQVQLAEDLSFFAVIAEPSNGETKSTTVAHDIQALSQHLQQNDKDPAECALYASFQEKWTNGPKRATVMYCKDSDVIFVVPEDMLGDTAVSAVLTTLYREVLYEIDQYVGSPKLCDKNVDQVLQLFKQVSAGLNAAPVSALNEETKEKYVAFVEFLHKLHGFTTKVNEVDQCINLGSQTLNKFKKTDGNALPAPAAEPPVQAEPADGEPDDSDGDSETGNDATPHGEEPPEDDGEEPEEQEQQPVLDGNLTFMPENNSVVPQNVGSPTQLANIIQQLHQVAILSPKTYAETKQSVMQLPLEARKAIQWLCGGLPLVYGGLDGGQPVFMPNTTALQANSLYNQVAHQLSGWYILIPKSGSKPDILFQLVKGKHKAIFQLTGYNEEVIKKMFTQSGNVWVGKFYTEQNTLKKTGNRVMVWSSDPAKFGSPVGSAATSSGSQPVPAQKGTKPDAAPVDQKRSYIVKVIGQKLLQFANKIKPSLWHHKFIIYAPILDASGKIIVPCNQRHTMTDEDWMRMAEHFDDIHPNSIKQLENLIYNQERRKEFLQALNISDINVLQFENKEPVPAEQKAKADAIVADIKQAFEKSDLAGISFQVVPPGRMPEYNVNPSFFQGGGWQKSDQYTVAFMFPGVNKQKFFGDDALKSLAENGIDVSKEYQAVKEKHSEIRLAAVFDDGFPA